MKKQLFFLFFTLIVSSELLAQPTMPTKDPNALSAVPTWCTPATPVNVACVPAAGPNNPIAGQEYTYTVTVPNPGTNTIFWYVTTDVNFITTAGLNLANLQTTPSSNYIMATGTTYNVASNTNPAVDITWKSFPATQDVFLVTYVQNQATGCTDNIKVYKIEPSHLFTLDINRIANDGTGVAAADHCIAPIEGAQYVETAGVGEIQMNYGINYLYFIVNAANWAHSWLPKFEMSGSILGTGTTTYAVDWQYPSLANVGTGWHSTNAVGNVYTSVDPVLPATVGETGVGTTGECIIVRVTVNHNQHQGEALVTLGLAVDGTMADQSVSPVVYTNATLGDIHYQAEAGHPCPWYDLFEMDVISYNLVQRPTVVDNSTPPATLVPDNGVN